MPFRIILFCFVICLSACGFTLRGTGAIPVFPEIVMIEPQDPYHPLQRQIIKQLELAQATITTSRPQSTMVLQLTNEHTSKQTIAIGTDGTIKQQLLIYAFDYQVKDNKGKTLIPTRTIRSNRVLYIQPAKDLSQDHEIMVLTNTMRELAAQQLLQQLVAYEKSTTLTLPVTSP